LNQEELDGKPKADGLGGIMAKGKIPQAVLGRDSWFSCVAIEPVIRKRGREEKDASCRTAWKVECYINGSWVIGAWQSADAPNQPFFRPNMREDFLSHFLLKVTEMFLVLANNLDGHTIKNRRPTQQHKVVDLQTVSRGLVTNIDADKPSLECSSHAYVLSNKECEKARQGKPCLASLA
jgi:hypothetical protein